MSEREREREGVMGEFQTVATGNCRDLKKGKEESPRGVEGRLGNHFFLSESAKKCVNSRRALQQDKKAVRIFRVPCARNADGLPFRLTLSNPHLRPAVRRGRNEDELRAVTRERRAPRAQR